MAARIFNKKQSLEREVKELYAKITTGTAPTAVLNLTADITLTSRTVDSTRNTNTVTTQVLAAAANPTDTVLVAFTGTAAAVVITVTPNDGTNNTATPVDLTTAELTELINTGAVVGKTITLTDASSLRADLSAAGGGATAMADGGEGDGVVATFSGGIAPALSVGYGFASISRTAAGDFSVVLSDVYNALKSARFKVQSASAQDIRVQIASETVASTKIIRFYTLTGATKTDPSAASVIYVKLDLKNTNTF